MIVNDRNYIWDIKRGDSANKNENQKVYYWLEGFNDWGGRGYDDFVPGEVNRTAPSGDRTT